MPGIITKIYHKVGDKVMKGKVLLTIEAMKMEHKVYATKNLIIKESFFEEK